MQEDMIIPLIDRFNNLIDSLINDFKEFKLDEEGILFLSKKTQNFIDTAELTLLNIIFKIFEKIDDVKYNFDDDIKISKGIIKKIFEDMNNSLNNILEHDHDEHHDHGHEHGHHDHKHHMDIDIKDVQKDIDNINEKLVFLKNLVDDISKILLLSLQYQNNSIDESEFSAEYSSFKEKMKKYCKEFDM